jgi:polar amino acid transport system ATP-binding protein
VNINGYSVNDEAYRKSIGFVFQNHNLFPHLTLKKNISLVLEKTRGYEKSDADEQADFYLSMLHLSDQANKLPKNVSGGQAQRASIARALSIKPDIIFLDEPTSALDPILTYEVLQAIEALKGLGKDFIFVTHVMHFVKDFADYVIFMDKGEIVEQGQPEILDHPKTVALQEFMKKVR